MNMPEDIKRWQPYHWPVPLTEGEIPMDKGGFRTVMKRDDNVIALQSWWMGELQGITKRIMEQEEKRQQKAGKKAADMLAEYRSLGEIQDAYGCGYITEKKYDKLRDLWEEREQDTRPGELYHMKMDLLTELYGDAKRILMDEATKEERHAAEGGKDPEP